MAARHARDAIFVVRILLRWLCFPVNGAMLEDVKQIINVRGRTKGRYFMICSSAINRRGRSDGERWTAPMTFIGSSIL